MDTPTDLLTTYGPWPIIAFLLWWLQKLVREMREDAKESVAHIEKSTASQNDATAVLNAIAERLSNARNG